MGITSTFSGNCVCARAGAANAQAAAVINSTNVVRVREWIMMLSKA
jgi:hypothetical protein